MHDAVHLSGPSWVPQVREKRKKEKKEKKKKRKKRKRKSRLRSGLEAGQGDRCGSAVWGGICLRDRHVGHTGLIDGGDGRKKKKR